MHGPPTQHDLAARQTSPDRPPCASSRATRLGQRLRRELQGWPLPLLGILSSYSFLRGLHHPHVWSQALAALHGDSEEADVAAPWAVLADHGDLMGLPAALEHWGPGRVAVGSCLALPRDPHDETAGVSWALLIAHDACSYRGLCQLLSWRHEEPGRWQGFLRGGACPDWWRGLIALIDDTDWFLRLRGLGARTAWRAGLRPEQLPRRLAGTRVPIVAAPLLAWLDEQDSELAPLLDAIRDGTTLGRQNGLPASSPFGRLSDLPAMRRAYAGFETQIALGRRLLASCRLFADHDPDRPRWHVPPAPVAGDDADDELRRLAEAGLVRRYGDRIDAAVYARLEMELGVIRDTRFAGYMLTVYDLAKGRTTCGRGSGASSLVCYLLGITNVDPVRYQLVFERFLTRVRKDPPDIDIDFPWDERDDVIQAALKRYGHGRAAMVVTHQRMSHKAALREAARAYGLADGAITTMRDQLRAQRSFGVAIEEPPPWPAIRVAAERIVDLPRHCGLHCGGVVITPGPIRELVPVHPAAKQIDGQHVPALAWEKDGSEQMGLVKIDLLGNRSLAVIRDCLQDLAADGVVPPRAHWLHPDTDPTTRRLVASGKTMGCFYIESPATRQLQEKAQSGEFDRLVVHSSIIRPAAMRYIDRYLERLWLFRETGELDPSWFPHPALSELLSESFGVLSYQEDVMLACQRLAGFDDHDANRIPKVLGSFGRSPVDQLTPLRLRFYKGCRERGIAETVIDEVWGMIESFTGYSFCKAHSASYAMVSFQCAYLKAHHPAYFMARVIANQGGFYGPSAYVEEARRLGIAILPPCVLHSEAKSRAAGPGAIRLGFQLIDGIGAKAIANILQARAEAPFASLGDLRHRAALDGDQLQALLQAGALDRLLPQHSPAQRAWLVAAVGRQTQGAKRDGQARLQLFGAQTDLRPPTLPPIPARELAWRQHDHLSGIVTAHHPLLLHDLPRRSWRCVDIGPQHAGHIVTVIGRNITSKQVAANYRQDRDGNLLPQPRREPMCFVTIEDETALLETVWFPEAFKRYGMLLASRHPLRITGIIETPFDCVNLHVRHVAEVGK